MQHHGPGHERVRLSAYEHRQFELITQEFADNALDRSREPPARARKWGVRLLCLTVFVAAGCAVGLGAVFGSVVGAALLAVVVVTAAGATVLCTQRAGEDRTEGDSTGG